MRSRSSNSNVTSAAWMWWWWMDRAPASPSSVAWQYVLFYFDSSIINCLFVSILRRRKFHYSVPDWSDHPMWHAEVAMSINLHQWLRGYLYSNVISNIHFNLVNCVILCSFDWCGPRRGAITCIDKQWICTNNSIWPCSAVMHGPRSDRRSRSNVMCVLNIVSLSSLAKYAADPSLAVVLLFYFFKLYKAINRRRISIVTFHENGVLIDWSCWLAFCDRQFKGELLISV